MSDLSELDNLLAELDNIDAPKPVAKASVTTKTLQSAPKPSAPAQPSKQASSLPPKPSAPAVRHSATIKNLPQADWDELDELVAKYDPTSKPSSNTEPISKPKQSPPKQLPSNSYIPPVQKGTDGAIDLNSLPSLDDQNNNNTIPNNSYSLPPPVVKPPSANPPTSKDPSVNQVARRPSNNPPQRKMTVLTPISMVGDVCGKCGQSISGEHLVGLGRKFHINHFSCKDCNSSINGEFYEHDNQPVCKNCFESKYSCSKCGLPLSGEYFSGNGKMFHASCVDRHICARCNQLIDVTSRELKALEKYWHPACFTCLGCNSPLSGTFFNIGGNPYCEGCATQQAAQSQGSCGGCGRTITTGTYISFDDKNYHSECFVCNTCKTKLDPTSFFSLGGKATCGNCVPK